jgi:hypothetical protein
MDFSMHGATWNYLVCVFVFLLLFLSLQLMNVILVKVVVLPDFFTDSPVLFTGNITLHTGGAQ